MPDQSAPLSVYIPLNHLHPGSLAGVLACEDVDPSLIDKASRLWIYAHKMRNGLYSIYSCLLSKKTGKPLKNTIKTHFDDYTKQDATALILMVQQEMWRQLVYNYPTQTELLLQNKPDLFVPRTYCPTRILTTSQVLFPCLRENIPVEEMPSRIAQYVTHDLSPGVFMPRFLSDDVYLLLLDVTEEQNHVFFPTQFAALHLPADETQLDSVEAYRIYALDLCGPISICETPTLEMAYTILRQCDKEFLFDQRQKDQRLLKVDNMLTQEFACNQPLHYSHALAHILACKTAATPCLS